MIQLLALGLLALAGAQSNTEQHKLVVVYPTTDFQVEFLRLQATLDFDLDFWVFPKLGSPSLIRLPGNKYGEMKSKWAKIGLRSTARSENLEKHTKMMALTNKKYREDNPWVNTVFHTELAHNCYRDYDEITDAVKTLKQRFPNLVTFDETASTPARESTIEGRPMHAFEMGAKNDAPVIFMEVNIHAREWITGAANMYMIDWLLTNYESNHADAKFVLDNYRIVNIPIANPDGLQYSHLNESTRYWRKNRRICSSLFSGVDLNRNFDYEWDGEGSSKFCGSDAYRGESPASEPESRAIMTLFKQYESSAAMYLSVHAFSQLLLMPWTYENSSTPVNDWHRTAGDLMAQAMADVEGHYYFAGTIMETIGYTANGNTMDWAMSRKMADPDFLVMGYELRPKFDGDKPVDEIWADFDPPVSEIVPAGKELLQSIIAAARAHHARVNQA